MATSTTIDTNKTKASFLSGKKKYFNEGHKGAGINVCVIDSGVNPHAEFGTRLLTDKSKNFCSYPCTGDDLGHGTHVASLIAGTNCGIAPEANIISYKVIAGDNSADSQTVIAALDYIYNVGYQHIDIVNMSLGGGNDAYVMTGAYEAAINRVVIERGIPIICAAGNTGTENNNVYPANFQEVITVGAVDINRQMAYFSTSSNQVDLAQVGVDVWGACHTGGYIQMSGTSMASPYACGIGALILSKYKKMFNKRMPEPAFYEMIKMNTVDIAGIGVDKNSGAGFCTLADARHIKFQTNVAQRTVNGVVEALDAAPTMINNRNYLPARHLAEPMNAETFWDGTNPTVFEFIS